jgi:hypothetical protein
MLGSHRGTYDAVFQHPIARNLRWRDVRSLLDSLAEVEEGSGGSLKFTRNGHTLVIHPPRRKDFADVHALMNVRRFLEDSVPASSAVVPEGVHLLVVIDHRDRRPTAGQGAGLLHESGEPGTNDRVRHTPPASARASKSLTY